MCNFLLRWNKLKRFRIFWKILLETKFCHFPHFIRPVLHLIIYCQNEVVILLSLFQKSTSHMSSSIGEMMQMISSLIGPMKTFLPKYNHEQWKKSVYVAANESFCVSRRSWRPLRRREGQTFFLRRKRKSFLEDEDEQEKKLERSSATWEGCQNKVRVMGEWHIKVLMEEMQLEQFR